MNKSQKAIQKQVRLRKVYLATHILAIITFVWAILLCVLYLATYTIRSALAYFNLIFPSTFIVLSITTVTMFIVTSISHIKQDNLLKTNKSFFVITLIFIALAFAGLFLYLRNISTVFERSDREVLGEHSVHGTIILTLIMLWVIIVSKSFLKQKDFTNNILTFNSMRNFSALTSIFVFFYGMVSIALLITQMLVPDDRSRILAIYSKSVEVLKFYIAPAAIILAIDFFLINKNTIANKRNQKHIYLIIMFIMFLAIKIIFEKLAPVIDPRAYEIPIIPFVMLILTMGVVGAGALSMKKVMKR